MLTAVSDMPDISSDPRRRYQFAVSWKVEGLEHGVNARLRGLGGAESFNDDLAQSVFAAEALDSIEYFYAG